MLVSDIGQPIGYLGQEVEEGGDDPIPTVEENEDIQAWRENAEGLLARTKRSLGIKEGDSEEKIKRRFNDASCENIAGILEDINDLLEDAEELKASKSFPNMQDLVLLAFAGMMKVELDKQKAKRVKSGDWGKRGGSNILLYGALGAAAIAVGWIFYK